MNVNALRDYLALYDQEMPAFRANSRSGYGMSETPEAGAQLNSMDAHNAANRRMMWAQRMASQQEQAKPQDFFSGGDDYRPVEYSAPRRMRDVIQAGPGKPGLSFGENFLRQIFQQQPYALGRGGVRG